MGLLANLNLRRKLLVALAPLVLVAILALVYASIESKQIDAHYSQLIDNEIRAVHNIDASRALSMRYRLMLYRLIVETGEKDIDTLAHESKSTPGELAAILLTLEFKGAIRSLPGKKFAAVS